MMVSLLPSTGFGIGCLLVAGADLTNDGSLDSSFEHSLKRMPIAILLIFVAVANQRHVLPSPKLLEKPESEFLSMIFDTVVPLIDASSFAEFLTVKCAEPGP